MDISHDHAAIRRHLASAKTIAVVGLSHDTHKTSHSVARYLQRDGYRIIPVNPTLDEPVLGERPYRRLQDIPHDLQIDIINVFRRSVDIPPVAAQALERPAPLFWMQLGISNEGSSAELVAREIDVVQSRCIKVDHASLL